MSKRFPLRFFLTIFLPIAALICAFALQVYRSQTELGLGNLKTQERLGLGLAAGSLDRKLDEASRDLRYLANDSVLLEAIENPAPLALTRLTKEISAFMRSRGVYDQIRWIDETGMERLRIDLKMGEPVLVQKEKLQDKSKRYFFTDTMRLRPGELYVSPLDLNVENDRIDVPHKPMIRLATPVFDAAGRKRGIVIINYLGRDLLDDFVSVTAAIADHAMLLNRDAYYLHNPNADDEWGFMFKQDITLARHYPDAWPRIVAVSKGQFEDKDGLWTFDTVFPLRPGEKSSTGAAEPHASGAAEVSSSLYFWKAVSRVPAEKLDAQYREIATPILFRAGALLALAAYLAWVLASSRAARHRAAEQLRDAKAMLESTGRMAKVGGWAYETDSKILDWSDELYRLHEVVPGRPPKMAEAIAFYAPEARPLIEAAIKAATDQRKSWDLELPFVTAKGKSIWVRSQGHAEDGDGGAVRLVGALQDISDFKAVQLALDAEREELEAKVESRTRDLELALAEARKAEHSKDEFLANISHELRTPLTVVIGLADLAMRQDMPAKPREHLEKIANAGRTLSSLINDLLDLSKIAAGRMELTAATFSPRRMAEHLRSIMEHQASDKNLQFVVQIDPELAPALVGDALRIEQVLLNLLGNAIKFSENGSIRLEVSSTPATDGNVRLDVAVSDSGIGISETEMEGLFQPFAQADASITRRFGGTGLGLALCKRLVELMGGRIAVRSETGVGSRFSFFLLLPRGQEEDTAALSHGKAYEQPVRAPGGRALVVDDQPINREIARELLSAIGLEVVEAADGAEALKIVDQHPPGYFKLVLMDVQMPVMDGLTATRCIRELSGSGLLPIIAMTARTMEHEKNAIRAAGMNDHIGKPFDRATFYLVISRWLSLEKGKAAAAPQPARTPATGTAGAAGMAGMAGMVRISGLDWASGLARFAGSGERYRHWLRAFVDDGAEFVRDMDGLLSSVQTEEACRQIHVFKDKVGMLGMGELHASASVLEAALKNARAADTLWAECRRLTLEMSERLRVALDDRRLEKIPA